MPKNLACGLAAGFSAVVLLVSAVPPALAFDARGGETVTVGESDTVATDLYAAGRSVLIKGKVNGDLWAAGRTVSVDGAVGGSIMAGGQKVKMKGDVGRTVRAAGETVAVEGNVEGDLLAFGNEIDLAGGAKVTGDLLVGAGAARIDGNVGGNLTGGGGKITIASAVGGDVDLKVERLVLASGADIKGNLTYTSVEEAEIHPGARVTGSITHNLPEVRGEGAKPLALVLFSRIAGNVIGFLMALVVGLVIILIAPGRLTSVAESIRIRPGPTIGWGAVVLFLTPIAAIIVCFTVIGLPIGLIALVLWAIAIYLAQIPVSLFLGRWITHRRPGADSKGILFGAFTLGLVILRLLRLIPVARWVFALLIVLLGLGAIVATLRRPAEAWEIA